jgi:hypothetical protein
MVYDLPLEEAKVKPHQVTTLHLVSALAFIVAGAIIVVYNYTIPGWGVALLMAGLFILLATIIKNNWITGKAVNQVFRVVELLIAAVFCAYFWRVKRRVAICSFLGAKRRKYFICACGRYGVKATCGSPPVYTLDGDR